mmetsp:Transcript_3794/g.9972  ORF Transcript_3794/g.9972 Transcript_3794/m.9972 type:complete len:230 (+) Transcript_3794:212-901(+)
MRAGSLCVGKDGQCSKGIGHCTTLSPLSGNQGASARRVVLAALHICQSRREASRRSQECCELPSVARLDPCRWSGWVGHGQAQAVHWRDGRIGCWSRIRCRPAHDAAPWVGIHIADRCTKRARHTKRLDLWWCQAELAVLSKLIMGRSGEVIVGHDARHSRQRRGIAQVWPAHLRSRRLLPKWLSLIGKGGRPFIVCEAAATAVWSVLIQARIGTWALARVEGDRGSLR